MNENLTERINYKQNKLDEREMGFNCYSVGFQWPLLKCEPVTRKSKYWSNVCMSLKYFLILNTKL
jgi:hypothetical protein